MKKTFLYLPCLVLMAYVAHANSPGGWAAGKQLGTYVALARKCDLDRETVNRYSKDAVKFIARSKATKKYIRDAQDAFKRSASEMNITATPDKCKLAETKIQEKQKRFNEVLHK